MRARPASSRRTWGAIGAVVALVLGLYVWTGLTSDLHPPPRTDAYNRLADAFLHGQLHLRVRPDPGLLQLPDPYDPGENIKFQSPDPQYIHDLSLYHGRFYAYWGPAPAVLLFAPARLLGLDEVPTPIAVVIFAALAFLAAAALLVVLTRRLLPDAPGWMVPLGVASIGFSNVCLFNLRRPAVYEVATTAGLAFSCLAALLVAVALARKGAPSRAASSGAGLCVGLALLSRPTLGILGVGVLGLAAWLRWRERRAGVPIRQGAAAALVAPFALCVLIWLIYNDARFGSPLETGYRYQLTGGGLPGASSSSGSGRQAARALWLLPGLWYYLAAPIRATLQFPFLYLDWPPTDPFDLRGYLPVGTTGGALWTTPILLALPLAPLAVRRRAHELAPPIALLAAAGVAVVVVTALAVPGTIHRYEADFATFLLVAALLTWLATSRVDGRAGRAVVLLGVAAIAWGAFAGLALSIRGSDDRLRHLHPGTFARLERFFAPLPTAATMMLGHPVITAADGDPAVGPGRLTALGIEGATVYVGREHPLELEVIAPRRGVGLLVASVSRGAAIPARVRVLVSVRTAGGGSLAVAPDGREHRFPLVLEQGINRVAVRLLADRLFFSATDQPTQAQAALSGIRLSGFR